MRTATFVSCCILTVASCQASQEDEPGACVVSIVTVPGTDLTDDGAYCADSSACQRFCDANKNAVNSCRFDSQTSCFEGDLANAPLPTVCALFRSINCGGDGQSFEAFCDLDCVSAPNTSEIDTDTGCLIEYRGPMVVAHSCLDALDQLK